MSSGAAALATAGDLRGALADAQPWTEQERRTLTLAYAAGGIAGAREALPHRSVSAITHCAARSGVYRRRRWTEQDDKTLRRLWDEPLGIDAIAKQLGRTRNTTLWRAYAVLRLPLGPPQGCEYVYTAAQRCGFASATLTAILKWAGVRVLPVRSRRGRLAARRYVDSFDCDRAVEAWLKTETVEAAAHRLGFVSGDVLRRKLREAGVETSRARHARVTEEQIEKARRVYCPEGCGAWWYALAGGKRQRCRRCAAIRINDLRNARRRARRGGER